MIDKTYKTKDFVTIRFQGYYAILIDTFYIKGKIKLEWQKGAEDEKG